MLHTTSTNLSLSNGIHQETGELFRESKLSVYLQTAINKIYDEVSDFSLFSLEIEERLDTPELKSALSPYPLSLLRCCKFAGINNVLDLSEDFGGSAHFLSGIVKNIDVLRTDIGKANAVAKRCRSLGNVTTYSIDLEKVDWENNSYDLILLGPSEELVGAQAEFFALLESAYQSLSDQGTLIVNSLNSARISRWFAAAQREDDAPSYNHLYGSKSEPFSIDNATLTEQFNSIGTKDIVQFATFGGCLNMTHVFRRDYLESDKYALNHFCRLNVSGESDVCDFLLLEDQVTMKQQPLFNLADRHVTLVGSRYTDSLDSRNNSPVSWWIPLDKLRLVLVVCSIVTW